MVIKVGINSFGRIGRVIFRTCCENSEIEVAAINDPAIDLGYMCYLIKFDSTHGKFNGSVSHEGDGIKINGRPVKVFHHKAPADIPWREADVHYVVEASGMFTSVEKASGHLSSDGVRRVIVTAPSADGPMLILGVNEDAITPDMKVLSCASSTLYCLAPIVKVLEDAFGVDDGFVTSIHAMTPSLKPLDGLCVRGKHWRDHRSIHQNIIPASTGACRAIGRIIPSCRDKLAGLAFRVPVVSVSVLDLCIRLNKKTTIDEITQIIHNLKSTALGNIIEVSNEKKVSSDFGGGTHSCILNIDSIMQIKPNFFKLICWLNKKTTIDEITHIIHNLKNTALGNIIEVSNEKKVSSDFGGETHSCILDIDSSMQIKPNYFKLICWYENEYSYSCRVVDTIIFSERQLQTQMRPPTRVVYMSPVSFESISNLQHLQSTPSNVRRPYISFCVPNLQNSSNLKPCSSSFIMRSNESPEFKLGHLERKRQSIKSYIDTFTTCNCNVAQIKSRHLETRKNPSEDKERKKGHEYLKNIEREISEMLNMTENLLNKSSNRKPTSVKQGFKKGSELTEQRDILRKNIIAKISDTLEKIKKEKINTQNVEMIADNTSLTLDVDDYQDKVSLYPREGDSLNNSPLKLPRYNSSTQIINIDISNVSGEKSNTWMYWDSCCCSKINMNLSLRETNGTNITNEHKTNVSEAEFSISPILENCAIGHKENDAYGTIGESRENLDHEPTFFKVTPSDNTKVTDIVPNKYSEESESKNDSGIQNNVLADKGESQGIVDSITDIDRKVRFGTIQNGQDQCVDLVKVVSENTLPESENGNCNIGDELTDHKAPEETDSLPGCSSSVVEIISEPLSGLISNYTLSNKNSSYIEDIYDKLDSESLSDSDGSFRIRKKTSRVLRITDLTYSLEDLPRLDKICRVLEISDELSDKLFAPLDNQSYENIPGRSWSFQDLCERIKFDEFCKELFEKPA